MAYLYRHIRLDTNEPFYIGIGSDSNYGRAHDKTQRSKYWKNIVSKAGYRVDIIFDNMIWEKVCRKEIRLIKLYGRQDLGTGILCNLTNGGEGNIGRIVSQETRDKISESVKKNSHWRDGRKHTKESIEKIIISQNKKVKDIITGVVYSSIKEVALLNNILPSTLSRKLVGTRTNNTNFILIS